MPNFSYIAMDVNRSIVRGNTEQADRASVINVLVNQNLRPVSVKLVNSQKYRARFKLLQNKNSRKVKRVHLVIMTRQLSVMISAGVPILRALTSLGQHTESVGLRNVLADVTKSVEGGASLADAMAKHPSTFDEIYTNMVRAGEAAGILDDILKRLAVQQEKNSSIRKRVKSALFYPITLIAVTTIAFFGLMIFVVPQIAKIMEEIGGPGVQLPFITRFMIGLSNFMINYWYIVIALVAIILFLTARFIKTKRGKHMYHTLQLKIPVVNKLITKIAIARFARTFSSLMGAGVAVLECITVTSRSVGNVLFEDALKKAAFEVKSGKQLSLVIGDDPIFPPIVSQMLAVGEETGQTDMVLLKVADFYEEEVDVAIEGVSSIIEPVMIIILGAMVGLIAASVMMPIASLAQGLQTGA
ncbi:MAG: type II secretion system F family protein [Polynucleobacter sp.]|nr:type II secretion system F family protein [Polynucleobacter sp.]